MVPATKLVYDFIRKHNSNDTGQNQNLPIHAIIAYLNEAQELWFRAKVKNAQKDSQIREELRYWKEDYVELEIVKQNSRICSTKYPTNLYRRLNQIAVTSKDCCSKSKDIIPRIIESDDLYEALANPYRKPDFFYEQLLAIESKDGLIIHTNNEMTVEEVFIDYYRIPQDIHAPTSEECGPALYYLYNGNVITKDQNFEGMSASANDIVDIAVLCASVDTKDTKAFQARFNLIVGTQNIHK